MFDAIRPAAIAATAALAVAAIPMSAIAQVPVIRPKPAAPCPMPATDAGGVSNAHTRYLETTMLPAVTDEDTTPRTLAERMKLYAIPGVSVAVIHQGKIDWARGWGVRDAETCEPVTADTAFQAASISKSIAATVAMRLADRGAIALDADVNAYLKTWKLPRDARFAPGFVTLRQLLSHTAGTGVHGFPGYLAGTPVPSIRHLLDGLKPANTPPVRLEAPPGTAFSYSGGGYEIAQLAMSDTTGRAFERLAEDMVLAPLGMSRSAFAQPASAAIRANVASGHVGDRVIGGRYYTHPELAAAGLWTSADDLARFLIAIREAAAGESDFLKPETARAMLTPVKPGYGLGLAIDGEGPGRRFGHNGSNLGYKAFALSYVEKGEGVIVLTNGEAGKGIADEIIRAVATDYGWTELASRSVVGVSLPEKALAGLTGYYAAGPIAADVTLQDGRLYAQTAIPLRERLIALSPTRFKAASSNIVAEFVIGGDGRATALKVIEGAPASTLQRAVPPVGGMKLLPLYLRGSMNDWSIAAPLRRTGPGSYTVDIPLKPGDYEFKLATQDWQSVDLGGDSPGPIRDHVDRFALARHGPNIALTVSIAGVYRFDLAADTADKATLTIALAPAP